MDSINGGVSKGVGYFTNQFAVLECPAGKVRVLNECLDVTGATGACQHGGSPCKKCEKDYALDTSAGTCHGKISKLKYLKLAQTTVMIVSSTQLDQKLFVASAMRDTHPLLVSVFLVLQMKFGIQNLLTVIQEWI